MISRPVMIGGVSAFLSICLTLAVVDATSGQDDKSNESDTSKAALERQLSAARKARVESTRSALAAVEASFQAQNSTVANLIVATRNLVEAQVDAAATLEEEIAAWTQYFQVAKDTENAVKKMYELGIKGGEATAYYTAKQERERAEISLLKAKLKAKQ